MLRCGHQGEWEGVMHPCTKVTSTTNHTLRSLPQHHYSQIPCGAPSVPDNGNALVFIKDEEYFVEFSCNKGYTLEGVASLKCQSSLQWQFGM